MAGRILTYSEKDTWIHRLSGVSKMIFFLLWSLTGMLTYDTRVLLVMLVCSLVIFKVSHTEWKQVGTVFQFILLFLCINMLAVWLFSPNQGTVIYGTKTELLHLFGNHNITKEQLFYQFYRDDQPERVCGKLKSHGCQLQRGLRHCHRAALHPGRTV